MADSLYDAGLKIRREVVGDDYVERALANAEEFGKPFQDLVTEYCWGAVWGRGGLDRKTRSMINLGMLAALNRSAELKLHTRGALRNGVTVEEITEVLLQATIYCGVPAGVEAFNRAREAIREVAAEPHD